jgi:hypothetical protein
MKKSIITVLVVVILLAGIFFVSYKKAKPAIVSIPNTTVAVIKNGRQCYTYSHDATTTEPYTTSEFIDITVNGTKVVGTKRGTQNGPDMTNGYTGTITGTLNDDTITDIFSYVIEGSPNKEKEIYKARVDQIGLEKLRYPLVEQGGILVPDTTKEFTTLLYARVGCTASN